MKCSKKGAASAWSPHLPWLTTAAICFPSAGSPQGQQQPSDLGALGQGQGAGRSGRSRVYLQHQWRGHVTQDLCSPTSACLWCMWVFLTTEFGFLFFFLFFLVRLIFPAVFIHATHAAGLTYASHPGSWCQEVMVASGVSRGGEILVRALCLSQPQWTPRSSPSGRGQAQPSAQGCIWCALQEEQKTQGLHWGRRETNMGSEGKAPASHPRDCGVQEAEWLRPWAAGHPDKAPGGIPFPADFSCSCTMKSPRWWHRQLCPPLKRPSQLG